MARKEHRQHVDTPFCIGSDQTDTPNGIVTNDSLYEFYRRTIKKLGLKRDGMIMGTHSFRRNAITDIVNATNGNVELAAQLCGNSGPVVKGNYLTGYDVEAAVNVRVGLN